MRSSGVFVIVAACSRSALAPMPVPAPTATPAPAPPPARVDTWAELLLRDPGQPTVEGAWGRGGDVWVVASAWDDRPGADLPSLGLILHSRDRGASWTLVRRGHRVLRAIWGTGDALIAVGGDILRSGDRGATWERVDAIAGADQVEPWSELYGIAGFDRDAWATSCKVGGFMSPSAIYHSADGGASWTVQVTDFAGCIHRIWATAGEAHAYGNFVTDTDTRGVIASTRDGGAHWARHVLDEGAQLDAIGGTARDVYIRGRRAGYHSIDGGAHWTKVTTIPVKVVDALSWRDGDAIDVLDPATGTVARR